VRQTVARQLGSEAAPSARDALARAMATAPASLAQPLAVALAGIVFIAWAPLKAARAYAQRAADFPTIAEFRGPSDLTFVTTGGAAVDIVELPAPWSRRSGERALRLEYDAQHAPAVQVVEPSPDWRGYAVVAADVTNPTGTELRLTFRIHDAAHDWTHEDRLNLPLVIAPAPLFVGLPIHAQALRLELTTSLHVATNTATHYVR
jgi:hypothetical protein